MKLKEWADKQGISYLTAWRWFKAGDPRLADAYQSDSGTIIVPNEFESTEQIMVSNTSNDVMSLFLKKTVEFSKSNASVEDFAAYILGNFTLKLNGSNSESPKYSRNKPKPEEVQNHFKQFLKPKGEKPKLNMFVAEPEALDDLMAKSDDLTAQELVSEINKVGMEIGEQVDASETPEMKDLFKDLSIVLNDVSSSYNSSSVKSYEDITEGVVARSVDLTPQLNYTGSHDSTFSNISSQLPVATAIYSVFPGASAVFQPTQKELQSVGKLPSVIEKSKRGRKPSKITGNK
jgi:hypothetical protein